MNLIRTSAQHSTAQRSFQSAENHITFVIFRPSYLRRAEFSDTLFHRGKQFSTENKQKKKNGLIYFCQSDWTFSLCIIQMNFSRKMVEVKAFRLLMTHSNVENLPKSFISFDRKPRKGMANITASAQIHKKV